MSLVLTDNDAGALFLFGGHSGGWRCRRWGWWLTEVQDLEKFAGVWDREFWDGVGHVLIIKRYLSYFRSTNDYMAQTFTFVTRIS